MTESTISNICGDTVQLRFFLDSVDLQTHVILLLRLDDTADAEEHVILRMRNTRGEIQDIRFECQPSRDSAQGVADELLAAGEDLGAVADNLDR